MKIAEIKLISAAHVDVLADRVVQDVRGRHKSNRCELHMRFAIFEHVVRQPGTMPGGVRSVTCVKHMDDFGEAFGGNAGRDQTEGLDGNGYRDRVGCIR